MKRRQGFVSNSSSSSFIVAIKEEKEKVCECCKQTIGGSSLSKLLENTWERSSWSDTELEGTFNTSDSVLEYAKEEWYDTLSQGEIEKVNKLEGAHQFFIGSISYHDDTTLEFVANPGVVVLYRCE